MPAKRKVANIVSVPAPIGGWNVRDPLPMMEPSYAPILDNVFCLPSELQVRKGWTEWVTFEGICKTIMNYSAASGDDMLLAAVDNSGDCTIYNINDQDTPVAVVEDLTSAEFKHCQYATPGGSFAYYVNGADNAVLFDGTTWYSVDNTSSPYAITGPASTDFIDVISHKRRLWFVPKNSLKVWYLPTDQIAGAAQSFDFSPIFTRGGKIVKIDAWSLDAGQGLDDYFVVFTSEGEVAVYTGTDPATASTWSLQGVFYIGTPTGSGRTCKYGGDLLIVNKDGIAQMSKSLMSSRVSTWLQLTDKIQPQIAKDTTDYKTNQGWDLLLYPPQNMLLLNVPVSTTESYQYVMNTISGAWARWTGIPARTWFYSNELLYWGGNGVVGIAWNGQNDNGSNIIANILPAYQNLGASSQLKRWTLGRLIVGTTGPTSYGAKIELDFNTIPDIVNLPIELESPYGLYGTAKYGESIYGGSVTVRRKWQNLSGMGYWGSFHIQIQTRFADVRVYSYDMAVESGGNL